MSTQKEFEALLTSIGLFVELLYPDGTVKQKRLRYNGKQNQLELIGVSRFSHLFQSSKKVLPLKNKTVSAKRLYKKSRFLTITSDSGDTWKLLIFPTSNMNESEMEEQFNQFLNNTNKWKNNSPYPGIKIGKTISLGEPKKIEIKIENMSRPTLKLLSPEEGKRVYIGDEKDRTPKKTVVFDKDLDEEIPRGSPLINKPLKSILKKKSKYSAGKSRKKQVS